MKKEKYIYGLFVLCFIIGLIIPIQSMAKVDPSGVYLDAKGNKTDMPRIAKIDWHFLQLKIKMIMEKPSSYPEIQLYYDKIGIWGEVFENSVSLHTRGKIVIFICDTREIFSSPTATKPKTLKYINDLKKFLDPELIGLTDDFDNDVVIYITSKYGIGEKHLLAYFYKGEFVILKDFP